MPSSAVNLFEHERERVRDLLKGWADGNADWTKAPEYVWARRVDSMVVDAQSYVIAKGVLQHIQRIVNILQGEMAGLFF